MRLDVLLKLGQRTFGFIEGKKVLLRIDEAHQFVLADFQLRASHRVSCLQERGLVLGRLDVGVRLGLDDFLLRLQQVAAILSQIVFLLAGIKFEHHVAGVNLSPRARQRDNLQRASADCRSGNGPRLAGSQDSRCGNLELKINFFDSSRRNFGIRRQNGRLATGEATRCQGEGKKKCR